MKRFVHENNIVIFICMILFVIPFLWFKPGEIDIGGDGGRLYFYDPINLIKNSALYYVFPSAIGAADARFFYLPFLSVLAFLKQIIHSPYILSSFYSGMKISIGFLSVYGIVKEFLKNKLINKNIQSSVQASCVLAGLFYIFNPAMTENYVRALPSHDQVFLNPLMFYFLLKYTTTSQFRFLSLALFISLIFSHSFSYTAAPPFFAFYPLGIIFLIVYTICIEKRSIPWKGLSLGLLLFLGLHAFHLMPEFFDLFSLGSNTNTRVFDTADILQQIGYFSGVLSIPKLSTHWFANSAYSSIQWASFIIPFVMMLGLILMKKEKKTIALTGLFFLVTFYFVNAKIANIGVALYKSLFYIPGFSMFRNFYGQWQFAYYFFYSLFFGFTVYYLLIRLRYKYLILFSLTIVLYLIVSSWQFINGQLINQLNTQSTTRIGIEMDPKFETTLDYIRSLPNDGKILLLPSTDYGYQVVHGLNNGAFVGRSMIGMLTGKKDFAGYMDIAPYSEMFWKLSKEKNFDLITPMLGLLNIQYIFYNSDSLVYDDTFSGRPYSTDYVRKYMPKNQKEYPEYISNIATNKIYENGPYQLFRLDDKDLIPHIYPATDLLIYEKMPVADPYSTANMFFDERIKNKPQAVYIDRDSCKVITPDSLCPENEKILENDSLKIQFERINPVKYKVKISGAQKPYVLVFSEAFHTNWKIFIPSKQMPLFPIYSTYFDGAIGEGKINNQLFDKYALETLGMMDLTENKHVLVNGYANAWYIKPEDTNSKESYDLIIEMTGQRIFWLGGIISIVTFILFVVYIYRLSIKRLQNQL